VGIDAMQVLDYCALIHNTPALGRSPVSGIYEYGDGVQVRAAGRDRGLISEVVRLGDEALLLAGDYVPDGNTMHRQIVSQKDWVHLQFRFSAGGSERINAMQVTDLPQRGCVISHYPKDTEIVRELSATERWTHVCIFATQQGLSELLDVAPGRLDDTMLGAGQAPGGLCSPLRPAMITSGQDILACSLRGLGRRAFMRAKSIELMSAVLTMLHDHAAEAAAPGIAPRDMRQIAAAEDLMAANLHRHLTLSEIARAVGMSRTKLATSFKAANGVSVQEYWRNLRLAQAWKALASQDATVTQAAFDAGYAEVSSFAKAFHARFGMLPRDCRRAQ
jgi:AraC family transcriptional regulator, transcriptional activator of the genes for pyochelin and ferripyochelin receptors